MEWCGETLKYSDNERFVMDRVLNKPWDKNRKRPFLVPLVIEDATFETSEALEIPSDIRRALGWYNFAQDRRGDTVEFKAKCAKSHVKNCHCPYSIWQERRIARDTAFNVNQEPASWNVINPWDLEALPDNPTSSIDQIIHFDATVTNDWTA